MTDPIRVLHVDDQPPFLELVSDVLARVDDRITVDTASSADDALDRLSTGEYDCIVSDYDMPGTNGLEFLTSVRADAPDLPFILYTGKGSEEVASEAISAGVTDYIQKESGTDHFTVLANRIENVVTQYRAEQSVERTRRRYQTLVEETSDAILVVDDEAIITDATPGSAAVLGRTPSDLVGTSGFEPIHPDDRARVVAAFGELAETSGGRRAVEFRYRRPDGTWIWADARGRNLLDDPVIEGIVIYTRDITDRKQRELELEERERRYEAIFNDPNILVGLLEPDGSILDVNETAMEYMTGSRDAVTGQRLWEAPWFEHSEHLQQEVREWIDRAATGSYVDFEAEMSGPEGLRPVTGVFRPVTDESGDVISVIVSARDVTERVQRERELERHEAYLQESTDVVTVLDETGTITYESPSVERVLGYEPGELIGEDGFEFVHPEDRESVQETFAALVGDPGATVTVECRFRTVDGEWRWLEVRGTNQLDNPAIEGVVTNNRDITDRKARERELERARDLLAKTEQIADVGGWELDTETEAVFWTENLFDILGLDPGPEPPLSEALDVYVDEDRPRVEAALESAQETAEPFDVEARFTRSDGERRWLRIQGVPITRDGDVVTIRGAVQDVTERKAEERRLEDQNVRLEQFASVVSHDLRSPLSVAETRLDLARTDCETQHHEAIQAALDRMQRIIEDMLWLAREGQDIGQTQPIQLQEMARTAWETVVEEPGNTASLVIADGLGTIEADPDRLRQLFENLFRNALDHAGDDVTVTVGPLDRGFFVADDGPGVAASVRDELFDPGVSSTDDGTGFGMAIVRRIAEAHGWEVELADSDDGARFDVRTGPP